MSDHHVIAFRYTMRVPWFNASKELVSEAANEYREIYTLLSTAYCCFSAVTVAFLSGIEHTWKYEATFTTHDPGLMEHFVRDLTSDVFTLAPGFIMISEECICSIHLR